MPDDDAPLAPLLDRFARGHACFSATLRIIGPLARQVEFPVEQHMPRWRCVRQKDTDLTVLDAPCGSAVLALDTHGLRSLLEKARLVN